jgi:predicted nucleotidyltransferase
MSFLQDNNVVAVYEYGSYVYGTNKENSDKDLIVVLDDKNHYNENDYIGYDVNLFSKKEFEEQIKEHYITALECIFLEKKHILKKYDWDFKLYLPQLRNSISATSSNSYVKCKKKFIVEQDYNPYIGQKSLWHSFRILKFGTQIAKFGKIINYREINNLLEEILKIDNWNDLELNYKKLYNETASEFKLVAPKEINLNSEAKMK